VKKEEVGLVLCLYTCTDRPLLRRAEVTKKKGLSRVKGYFKKIPKETCISKMTSKETYMYRMTPENETFSTNAGHMCEIRNVCI